MLLFPRNCCHECCMGLGGGRGDRGWNSGCRGHPGLEHCSGEQSNNWTSETGPARYGNKSKSVSRFVPPSSSHLLIPRTSIPLSPPLLSVPPSLSPPSLSPCQGAGPVKMLLAPLLCLSQTHLLPLGLFHGLRHQTHSPSPPAAGTPADDHIPRQRNAADLQRHDETTVI